MEKQEVIETLKEVRKNSPKRNFKQSVELIINLKGIDFKKQENQINIFANLHYSWGKKVSVCAFVGPELKKEAETVCDQTITVEDFPKYKDKKLLKQLAKKHDFFIAQANIMPQVATTFGRVLGPLGKMPNPKIGCILPPNGNVKALYERLQKTKRLMSRNNPIIQSGVGKEDMGDEEIVDNIMTIYNNLIHALPNEKHNIKDVYLKLTMGRAFRIGKKAEEKKEIRLREGQKAKTEEKKNAAKEEAKEGKEAAEEKSGKEPKEKTTAKKGSKVIKELQNNSN
jgi:large subunit ribosomal protein L1